MIIFDNVDVIINRTGIIAENASISIENSIQGIAALGRRGVINQSPSGPLKTSFDFSYNLDLSNEPNFWVADTIKKDHQNFHYEPIQLVIGGITGSGYLENYSIRIQSNDVGRANATYACFTITGDLQNKNNNIDYNLLGYSGLAHGWVSHLYTDNNYNQIPTYDFSYDFRANWNPVYKIGSPDPIQVQLFGIQEEASLTRDIYKQVDFSGNDSRTFLGMSIAQENIVLEALSNVHNVAGASLNLNISGGKVKNTQVSAGLDDFVKVRTKIQKFY